ncbi:MAG: hypothetical protein JNM95_12085 [Chitinophagaceae bacterium]|nr:hypothetical protein [Chitinophagaceae bacterium]
MNEYTYEVQVKAKTKEESIEKMQAICTLLDKLNEKELSKLAYIVKHDPIKTKMAKMALGV